MIKNTVWPSLPAGAKVVFSAYILCFAAGFMSHLMDFINKFPSYQGFPIFIQWYWSSLLIFDILVVVLLFVNIRSAVLLAVLVMLSDVIMNTYVTYNIWDVTFLQNHSLWLQTGFAVFVLLTAPVLWKETPSKR